MKDASGTCKTITQEIKSGMKVFPSMAAEGQTFSVFILDSQMKKKLTTLLPYNISSNIMFLCQTRYVFPVFLFQVMPLC